MSFSSSHALSTSNGFSPTGVLLLAVVDVLDGFGAGGGQDNEVGADHGEVVAVRGVDRGGVPANHVLPGQVAFAGVPFDVFPGVFQLGDAHVLAGAERQMPGA